MRKLTLVLLLTCVAGGAFAWRSGVAGKAVGTARSWVMPSDVRLLSYLPAQSVAVAVVNAAYVQMPADAQDRRKLENMLADLEKVSGVRPAVDVDALAFGAGITVARGRFDWTRMGPPLEASGYVLSNEGGRPLAFREQGGETLAVDGAYLLYGTLDEVKNALDRHTTGKGLQGNSPLGQQLDALSWRNTLTGALQVSTTGPSVSEVLSGTERLRSVGFSLRPQGQDALLHVLMVSMTTGQAERLKESAEKQRQAILKRLGDKTPNEQAVRRAVESATIELDDASTVSISAVIPAQLVDELERTLAQRRSTADALGGVLQQLRSVSAQ